MSEHNIFYIPVQSIGETEIVIRNPQLHHIREVLRKRTGDSVLLTDGQGYRYQAKIYDVGRTVLKAKIFKKDLMPRKSSLEIAVGFVPVKGLRNDLVIEKGTELGVARFIVFVSEYSVLRNLSAQKLDRFRKIAASAMIQSQQYYLPEIRQAQDIQEMLQICKGYDLVLMADPHGKQEVRPDARKVLLVVGPEGGFSDSETTLFTRCGALLFSLGSTRLRSETAAIVGVTKIFVAYGIV